MPQRILVPWSGMELMPPAVEAQSSNHCTTGEVQELFFFLKELCFIQ